MNLPLFKFMWQRYWKLTFVFFLALTSYALAILSMYDPIDIEKALSLFTAMPQALLDVLGFDPTALTAAGYLASGFYNISYVIFMLIFMITLANQLCAKLVDRGSMAYLLAAPYSRRKVIMTLAAVLISGLLAIAIGITVVGFAFAGVTLGSGILDAGVYLKMNIVGFLLLLLVGGYCFLFSCLFNDERKGISTSAGLTGLFFILNAVSRVSPSLRGLRYASILALFQPTEISKGAGILGPSAVLLGGAVLTFSVAIVVFIKKDLPL